MSSRRLSNPRRGALHHRAVEDRADHALELGLVGHKLVSHLLEYRVAGQVTRDRVDQRAAEGMPDGSVRHGAGQDALNRLVRIAPVEHSIQPGERGPAGHVRRGGGARRPTLRPWLQ